METKDLSPYGLMNKEGIPKSMLSAKTIEALELYEKSDKLAVKNPKSAALWAQAKKVRDMTTAIVQKDIEDIRKRQKNDIEELHQKETRKKQSKMIVDKSEQVFDELALCREKLKEERKRKIESGEIAPPKKKNLTQKLRTDLARIVGLIPNKLKEDTSVITRTEKAVLKFLSELKDIWGMNKIKPIEDEINERINKLREQAA